MIFLQRQRDLNQQWSALVIQRHIRKWLCRNRAIRVRQARLAYRDRAARTIQFHWRGFIAEKRRYEATCARLRARLRREQEAAAFIIAELQLQTQSISLPSANPEDSSRKRSAGRDSLV